MTSRTEKEQLTLIGQDFVEVQIQAFLNERKAQNLAKGSIQFYKDTLLPFAKYLEDIEVKYISQITPSIIRDFLLVLGDRGHNEGGIHGYYRSIKAFLRWYWDEVEPEEKNPIDKVKAPKVSIEPLEGISKKDFDALIDACPKNNFYGERDKTILMVLLDTGVRANELCQINIEDINLTDSSILIRQGKGRKPRFVFIGKSTRKQLRKWFRYRKSETGALFINRQEERISYTILREILRRLSLKAGLEKLPSPHDFRRAFCLNSLRAGVDLLSLSRLMGHHQRCGRRSGETPSAPLGPVGSLPGCQHQGQRSDGTLPRTRRPAPGLL